MALWTAGNVLVAVPFVIVYFLYIVIYRLFLSPIAKFPGPRLAAFTLWYEFYYDVICRGQYEFEIAKMHQKYGPIVRINPYQLHIDDPDYHDTLYPGTSSAHKIDKWPWEMKQFGNAQSSFGAASHDLHRLRRSAVAPLFSKRSIYQLSSLVQLYVDKLVSRLAELRSSGSPVNLINAYSALTGDIISQYCFGASSGFIEDREFSPHWHQLIHDFGEMGHTCKHFGLLMPLMESLPPKLVTKVYPMMAAIVELNNLIARQISQVQDDLSSGNTKAAHRTIFHEMLESDLPAPEKSIRRLRDEGRLVLCYHSERCLLIISSLGNVFMTAGTGTTADTLSITSFYILSSPAIRHRLRDDLRKARKEHGPLQLQHLEQIPYLTAVIKEGLRHSHGVCQRLSRVFPDHELQFREWTIPAGVPVAMSSWITHNNPDIFPEPDRFIPDRWLGAQKLDKYIVAWSKGTRQCVGINLAWAELYCTLAAIFGEEHGLKLELFETDVSDVKMTRDKFVVGVKDDSKGVRVLVE
ncbi:MAG: hypothetical protein Q9227_003562 [Pyrenula ochraceoflavens]